MPLLTLLRRSVQLSSHQVGSCSFSKPQFCKKTTAPYKTSEAYTKLISSYPTIRYIPGSVEINALKNATPSTSTSTSTSTPSVPSAPSGQYTKKTKGKNIENYISSVLSRTPNADYLMVSLTHDAPQPCTSEVHHEVAALVDTGSLAGDFVALRVIQNLKLTNYIVSTSHRTVCSGLDNKCYDISRHIPLYVSYFSEALNKTDVFLIDAIVLDSSPVDLLIGKQTIRKTQIFSSVPSQLSSNSVTATSVAAISEIAESATSSCGCQPTGESIAPGSIPATFAHLAQNACSTAAQTPGVISALLIESEQLLGVAPLDDDEIDDDKTDAFSHWNSDSDTPDSAFWKAAQENVDSFIIRYKSPTTPMSILFSLSYHLYTSAPETDPLSPTYPQSPHYQEQAVCFRLSTRRS